ncbi:hypothetical protein WR25_26314 [Diploscapter pachys]|uniref:Uncharacterized protein n=1 Tax=Diploscapter pachys TaxID=2018661 RepID=A0A2A2M1R9_9BILA|nr:hypothetical protein WR25_26314 [Diploscapter pachys]
MLAHEVPQHAAVGRRPSQCGQGFVGIGGSESPPDRLVLFGVVLTTKHGNGILGDQPDFDEVFEEAIDNADLVEQRRHSPTFFHFLQPDVEHLPVNRRMTSGYILEAAKEPAISRSASRPELRFFQESVNNGAIGIVPGAHDSISEPGVRIGLGVTDTQGFSAPVHVFKPKAADLTFAQPICGKQLKYRKIAHSSRRSVLLRRRQHRGDLALVQRRGHVFIGVEHGADDVRREISRDTSRPMQIAHHRPEPLSDVGQ